MNHLANIPLPNLHRLDDNQSLSEQIARFLKDHCFDSAEVWIPTKTAERTIRNHLGNNSTNLRFYQPMQALLGEVENAKLASRSEREAAWCYILKTIEDSEQEALLPFIEILNNLCTTPQEIVNASFSTFLGLAGMLCDVEDILAEAGLWPGSPQLMESCHNDSDRWKVIQKYSERVQNYLRKFGLYCPNQIRLQNLSQPQRRPTNLVIAGLPDLPKAAEYLATRWMEQGSNVYVLVWHPQGLPAGFDPWGRPLTQEWNQACLSIQNHEIYVAKDQNQESKEAIRFLQSHSQKAALIALDAEIYPGLLAAAKDTDLSIHNPAGIPLERTESGRIALLWNSWVEEKSFSTFCSLLNIPLFVRWFEYKSPIVLGRTKALNLLNFLNANNFFQDILTAKGFYENKQSPKLQKPDDSFEFEKSFIIALESISKIQLVDLINDLIHLQNSTHTNNNELIQVKTIIEFLQTSRLINQIASVGPDFQNLKNALLAKHLASERYFPVQSEGAVNIYGWLEAPWLDAEPIMIMGCRDSTLPGVIREHPFLPDSLREKLGLPCLASRMARDAYLLESLRRSRVGLSAESAPYSFKCSFSRHTANGSPSLPSPLLLRCSLEALPQRVKHCLTAPNPVPKPVMKNTWRWHLPEEWRKPPPTSISATDFGVYLRCPLRFYFSRVLKLEPFTHNPQEMDAKQFGTLIHKVLENFAVNYKELQDENQIANNLIRILNQLKKSFFAKTSSLGILAQLDAIWLRLRAFAKLQASLRQEGWAIHCVEKIFQIHEHEFTPIMELPLSAKIDRIDINSQNRKIRIYDYKTGSSGKSPQDVHFTKPKDRTDPSHCSMQRTVTVDGKNREWADLQLPLYHCIAQKLFPKVQPENISVAYIVLPAEPQETAIKEFPLKAEIVESALDCARQITKNIKKGIFWPPGDLPESWDDPFSSLFVNQKPEECFTEDTINFLKGIQ